VNIERIIEGLQGIDAKIKELEAVIRSSISDLIMDKPDVAKSRLKQVINWDGIDDASN
jgi:hypothetical protein